MSILLVEPDDDLKEILSFLFRRRGHDVIVAQSEAGALAFCQRKPPRLVITETELPEGSGWSLCKKLQAAEHLAVIFLSSSTSDNEAIRGLELGAEDFVAKPFSPRMLLARVEAVLRRAAVPSDTDLAPEERALAAGEYALDPQWRRVRKGKKRVSLTPIEFKLLHQLMLHKGQVLPHQILIDRVWGYSADAVNGDSSLMKGHIRNLRRKLGQVTGEDGPIRTVTGVGYCFVGQPALELRSARTTGFSIRKVDAFTNHARSEVTSR